MEEELKKEKDDQALENSVSLNLAKVLNRNGFSFQYSVVRRADNLIKEDKSRWQLEGTEIPVGARNDVTHVDFICRYRNRYQAQSFRLFLIAECKRADPARGYWCFAKSPYTWRNRRHSAVQFDVIRRFSDIPQFTSSSRITPVSREITELGLEIKTGDKGDGLGTNDKSAINKAVSQVLRGCGGFIDYVCDPIKHKENHILEMDTDNIFIPVIFTTARLFVTETDIGSADLRSGFLPKNSVDVQERDWIWLNHNRSIHLSHNLTFDYKANERENLYYREFTRSVAIVGPNGINSFFQANFEELIDY